MTKNCMLCKNKIGILDKTEMYDYKNKTFKVHKNCYDVEKNMSRNLYWDIRRELGGKIALYEDKEIIALDHEKDAHIIEMLNDTSCKLGCDYSCSAKHLISVGWSHSQKSKIISYGNSDFVNDHGEDYS